MENEAQDFPVGLFGVEIFVTAEGRSPFLSWLNSITDLHTSARILVALDELRDGALRASRSIGGGVYEHVARIPGSVVRHFIYFAIVGRDTLLVVGGGSTTSQKEDSARAFDLWKEFKAHAH